ncbi:MAG: IS630 family transposase, partial [Chloroflexota bacterium]
MKTKYFVELSDEKRQELEVLIRAGNAPARTQTRARILLLSDRSHAEPKTGKEIASALLCSPLTIT